MSFERYSLERTRSTAITEWARESGGSQGHQPFECWSEGLEESCLSTPLAKLGHSCAETSDRSRTRLASNATSSAAACSCATPACVKGQLNVGIEHHSITRPIPLRP